MKKTHNPIIFSSACFRIFPERGHVETEQTSFRLGPVNMAVLTLLIEQHGQVVSRSALFDSVWKNQIVSDDVLTRSISDIRSQLSKHTKIKLIETLPKRGYRWLPDVSIVDQACDDDSNNNDSNNIDVDVDVDNNRDSKKQTPMEYSLLSESPTKPLELSPRFDEAEDPQVKINSAKDTQSQSRQSQSQQSQNQQVPIKDRNNKDQETEQASKSNKDSRGRRWLSLLKTLSLAMVTLFFIATSSLWMVDKMLQNQLVRVALIPIQADAINQDSVGLEIDDILRAKFSQIEGVRFLARSAVTNRPQNAFKYLSREFATQWIIEGHVRVYQNKLRVSLSLVDAHTATVSYALRKDLDNDAKALEQHCLAFIEQALSIILPAE